MKTTFDIADSLLKAAKTMARDEGTTLREIVERSLRAELKEGRKKKSFKLRHASVKGQGIQSEAARLSWEQLRDLSYETGGR